jgi:hypothetical protein
MHLVVCRRHYIKKTHKSFACVGNKGAIGIRFKLYDTLVCFVCAHLAAGQSHVDERNQNYLDATAQMAFGTRNRVGIAQHDVVIWLGDFNYRIDLAKEAVECHVAASELAPLLAADQLCRERAAGRVFVDYHEGTLDFAPTYKYDVGTTVYDTSEKARAPAWTDRILYKVDQDSASKVCQKEVSRRVVRVCVWRGVGA